VYTSDSIQVVPPDRWPHALDLLLTRLPADVRASQRLSLLSLLQRDPLQAAGLVGAFRDGAMLAACWVQLQAGRVANLWPVSPGDQRSPLATPLLQKAIDFAIARRATMVQSLLLTDTGPEADLLRRTGFDQMADLLYLSSASEQFPDSQPAAGLRFIPFSETERRRLAGILERTYDETRDCPALNGVRMAEDVLEGYRAVGRFRPDLWMIAQSRTEDIGCLLLAEHAPQRLWELVYMGIVPEARGRGLGLELTRYAQWLGRREKIERLLLAVDAANEPAIAMYAAAGFVCWDRRSVFVRVLQSTSSNLP